MVFWRYASQTVIIWPDLAKGNIALRILRHLAGEHSFILDAEAVFTSYWFVGLEFTSMPVLMISMPGLQSR